jgi:hypothetical protein
MESFIRHQKHELFTTIGNLKQFLIEDGTYGCESNWRY